MEKDIDIDSRSEVVRDYLERIPNKLVRWGTTVIFLVVTSAILLTWFIKYPTSVHADFKLTTRIAPKAIVSRVDGRLEKLLAYDHERVKPEQILAFMQSNANYEEVLQLKDLLYEVHKMLEENNYLYASSFKAPSWSHLGELQSAYLDFCQKRIELSSFLKGRYYSKRINFLENDVNQLKEMNAHLQDQYKLYERDAELAKHEFALNQDLFQKKVIPKLDLDKEESKMLTKEMPSKTIQSSILNNNIQINIKHREAIDLGKELFEHEENFRQASNLLLSAIDSWMNRYALVSPSSGELVFSNNLQEKDDIKASSELFRVFKEKSNTIGTLIIAQSNLGKVFIGQRVLIKFHSYPFEEYGLVEGKILSLPQLSTQDNNSFFALVELPNGLRTSHDIKLAYKYGMSADAEIITEDLRLIERIFYTIRKIFK